MIYIRLFGPPSVTNDGVHLSFPFKKMEALAYLLASQKNANRRWLGQILWPDKDEKGAMKNLRNALYRLRSTFPDGALISGEGCIKIFHERIRTDLNFMGNLSSLPDRDIRRIGLPFLDGFSLDDGDDFNKWVQDKRDSLRERYLDELTAEAEKASARGDDVRAVTFLQNALTAVPWDEETARKLMKVLKRRGNLPKVVATYIGLSETLREEMGLDPSPETVSLYRSIFQSMDVPPDQEEPFVHKVDLPSGERELMEILSVFGGPTPLADIEYCSDLKGKELEGRALRLEKKGLLSLSYSTKGPLAVRIASNQLESAMYKGISPLRRALLHRRILEKNMPGTIWTFSSPQDGRDLIRHADNGGSTQERITSRIGYLRLLSIGLCQGYPPIADPVLLRLEEDRGLSHSTIEDLASSIQDLFEQIGTDSTTNDIPSLRTMFRSLSGFYLIWKGETDKGREELEYALSWGRRNGNLKMASEALHGLCLMAIRLGDNIDLHYYSEKLSIEGREEPLRRALAERIMGQIVNAANREKSDEHMKSALDIIRDLRSSGFSYSAMEAMVFAGMATVSTERDEANKTEEYLMKGLNCLVEGGIRHGRWIFHSALAYTAWKRSDGKNMLEQAEKSRENVDDVVYGDLGILYHGMQALASSARGEGSAEIESHLGRARFSASWLVGKNKSIDFLKKIERELRDE